MFGIAISILILTFGVFLQKTKNPGFASSKRLAKFFIILGILSLILKTFNYFFTSQNL